MLGLLPPAQSDTKWMTHMQSHLPMAPYLCRVCLDLILQQSLVGLQVAFTAGWGRHGAAEGHTRAAQAHQLLLHFLQLPGGFRAQRLLAFQHPLQVKGLQHQRCRLLKMLSSPNCNRLLSAQVCSLWSMKGSESIDNTAACIQANVIAPHNVQTWLLMLKLLSEKHFWVSREKWLSASTEAQV